MRKKRIAVLLYEKDNEQTLNSHQISVLTDFWREDGHDVIFLFGIEKFVPADLLFVHVDLSDVPDSYLEFAQQYPVVVNGKIKSVRKSTYSPGLLSKEDSWNGLVIVKSDKNSAGIPERTRTGFRGAIQNKLLKVTNRILGEASPLTIRTANDYKIYDHLNDVPRICFYHPGLIVQKFMPEIDDGYYCVRVMFFLGEHSGCMRLRSKSPIVNDATVEDFEMDLELHPDIIAIRKDLQFDYGKFDYVVVNNKGILLDANKTLGWPPNMSQNPEMQERLRYHSTGLYSFLYN